MSWQICECHGRQKEEFTAYPDFKANGIDTNLSSLQIESKNIMILAASALVPTTEVLTN